jgi:Lysyl oxidase
MPARAARRLAPALACGLAAISPPAARGEGSEACRPDRVPRVRCPDLVLRTPYGRYFERAGGRIRYHAANSIVNRGQGPAELFARRRTSSGPMPSVTQRIYGFDGRRYDFPSPGARVVFKPIPVLGPYWKFDAAARFELWSADAQGNPRSLVRIGPKLVYCLRDLRRRLALQFSPPVRRYPACSQDPARRSVTLGTSVGWADEYPADYHEQWIDVTGLRGRFVFVQRVDPRNSIRESDETNNVSPRIILRLPPPRPSSPAPKRPGY